MLSTFRIALQLVSAWSCSKNNVLNRKRAHPSQHSTSTIMRWPSCKKEHCSDNNTVMNILDSTACTYCWHSWANHSLASSWHVLTIWSHNSSSKAARNLIFFWAPFIGLHSACYLVKHGDTMRSTWGRGIHFTRSVYSSDLVEKVWKSAPSSPVGLNNLEHLVIS